MSRKLKLFILISVSLNIVLIGFVLGRGSGSYRLEIKKIPDFTVLLENSSIPEARRAELKKKLQELFPDAEERKVRRQWYEKTIETLKAEEFDADAFRAQLDRMFVYLYLNRQKRVEIMTEVASELNQEEREDLAEIFSRKLMRK